MVTVASSAKACELRLDCENRGAGGKGRRGLPPYLDEGVPGLGLPLRSDGSNETLGGGGRAGPWSEALEAGVQGRRGKPFSLFEKGTYVESGGGMLGGSSMDDAGCEYDETALG